MTFSKKILFICGLVFFYITTLLADDYHYISVFIGDRAAGLSGAYTAIADGPEGTYYNPAGLAFSSSKYFSLSANAVQFKQLIYRDISPGVDYTRYSFSFIPNFFGFLQKAKKFTFAITIASPDSEFYDQRDAFNLPHNDLTEDIKANVNLNLIDMVYEVGPSFAFLPHKRLAIGFGIFFKYRDYKLIYSQTYTMANNQYFYTASQYFSERLIGLKLQFGLQAMPVDFFSIGYNISLPIDIVGIYNQQATNFAYYSSGYQTAVGLQPYNFDENMSILDNKVTVMNFFKTPFFKSTALKQALGIAFFISKSILVSADFYLYIPLMTATYYGKSYNQWVMRITWNVATGIEWYITPNFPIRLGFFTNNSNRPPVEDGKMNQDDYVNLYGGSFTIGYATSSFTINLGGTFSYGRGRAQIKTYSTDIQDLDAFAFNLFISGGYQF